MLRNAYQLHTMNGDYVTNWREAVARSVGAYTPEMAQREMEKDQ